MSQKVDLQEKPKRSWQEFLALCCCCLSKTAPSRPISSSESKILVPPVEIAVENKTSLTGTLALISTTLVVYKLEDGVLEPHEPMAPIEFP